MKKLFSLLFAAGIATGAFATDQDKVVNIRQTEAKKVAVTYAAVPQGTVIVKITDSQDRLVMRDKINKEEAFAKRYDLNALPEGTYEVEVLDESGVIRTASFDTFVAETPEVFSRVTKMGENKYRLLVSNLEAKEVSVSIFDGDQLIHSERIDNPQGLHKIYDIDKPNGNITFKVSTDGGFESYVTSRY